MSLVRKFWPLLALVAAGALIYFELRTGGGVTAENAFWLFVAALIILLVLYGLFQRNPPDGPDDPLNPD